MVHIIADDFSPGGREVESCKKVGEVFVIEVKGDDRPCHPELLLESEDDADELGA